MRTPSTLSRIGPLKSKPIVGTRLKVSIMLWELFIRTSFEDSDCILVLLVGNKADMASERVVTTERGQELAQQLGK